MLNKQLFFLILILTASIQSCGTFLDMAGKGAKTTCLSLETGNQTIHCNCEGKQMTSITIYRNQHSKENFGKRISQFAIAPVKDTFTLPVSQDSLNNGFWQIEIHLTDSHWRESYYIKTAPGDFSKSQTIYSRYFSH